MTGKRVKLCIYRHESKETIIDTYEAQDWGHFVIVRLKGANLSDGTIASAYETFKNLAGETDKVYVLLPEYVDNIEFYGVKVDD